MSAERRLWIARRAPEDSPDIERRHFLRHAAAVGLAAIAPTLPAMAQTGQSHSTVGSGQVSLAETLARYATELRYEDLPEDVIRIARRAILDTIGCAFGGYAAGPSKIAIKLASEVSSRQAATVLIGGIKTSPDLAAFANGTMIRYLDFNDAFVSLTHGAGHPSDTIAALLTSAEFTARSGRDLVTATVLAYEVFCKIADVFDYLGNGIDHSTITGIAAVVGAGRLMGLTAQQMVHAIGITVGGNTATRQGRADELSNWKAFAAADACRKAIFAAQLAQGGMTGPSQIFEGRYGFFKVMGRRSNPRSLASRSASDAPSPNAFRLASFHRPSPKPPWKRGRFSKVRTTSMRSTFTSRTPRSRSWLTDRTSGGRRHTKPPITASPMRRVSC
jgi:2-methylcitrate dehydratase